MQRSTTRILTSHVGSLPRTPELYARLQANPPLVVYLTSGGRLLLMPLTTILVAAGLLILARIDGVPLRYVTALAITVHATVVLAVQQLVALPFHYVQEALTSPTTVAGVLRIFDEGTWAARLFGTIDVLGHGIQFARDFLPPLHRRPALG